MGANSAARYLVTNAINIHLTVWIFDYFIVYEEYFSIKIIRFLRDIVCLKFDNREKLKLQSKFTVTWNLNENIVAYFLFLKKKQDKLLKCKVPCSNAAMFIQAVSQMEISNYFKLYDIIELEEKYKWDQTFAVVQIFFKKKYDSW